MRYTSILAAVGAAICLFHYLGLDPNNMIFYSLSIPAWFIPVAANITNFNIALLYLLTVLSWAVIGYIVDRALLYRKRSR